MQNNINSQGGKLHILKLHDSTCGFVKQHEWTWFSLFYSCVHNFAIKHFIAWWANVGYYHFLFSEWNSDSIFILFCFLEICRQWLHTISTSPRQKLYLLCIRRVLQPESGITTHICITSGKEKLDFCVH